MAILPLCRAKAVDTALPVSKTNIYHYTIAATDLFLHRPASIAHMPGSGYVFLKEEREKKKAFFAPSAGRSTKRKRNKYVRDVAQWQDIAGAGYDVENMF